MHSSASANIASDEMASALLIRKLSARYLLVLAVVAALVILDQAVIQPALLDLNSFAPAINLAGRQRMLSQRLTKAALAMQAARNDAARLSRRREMQATQTQWTAAHDELKSSTTKATSSTELAAAWANLEPHFHAMSTAAEKLFTATTNSSSFNANAAAAVEELASEEPRYLPAMERIVMLLEQSSGRQVARLRLQALLIAGAVIVLLVALGYFIVLPATRTIRGQVDGLEHRVAERTAELSTANLALEQEIAEHQQAEIEKQRLAAELTHAARLSSLGHLAAGLAHEINQPLCAIANFSEACELLLNEKPQVDQDVVGHFEQIKRAALRAGQIVRRIRNFAQPIESVATAASLNLLVREVAELCRYEADQADIRILLKLCTDDALVQVDSIQIQQVLVNLIQNSIHALQTSRSTERWITIATSPMLEAVRVEVTDTGPGFGSRDPNAIFAPYFTTKTDGLGIGLSLARTIVDRHGGTIWAESPPEGGARLNFTLPRCLNHDDACRESTSSICSR